MSASAKVTELPSDIVVAPLAGIVNDRDKSISHLDLMLDRQAVVRGIYMETRVPQKKGVRVEADELVDARVYWHQRAQPL